MKVIFLSCKRKLRIPLLEIILLFLVCDCIHAQTVGFNIKNLVQNLDDLSQRSAVERIFIHTDRDAYHIGDTIWLKSYVFEGAYLDAAKKSELLYIELVDDSAEVVRRVCIRVKNGTGHAQIPLSREIFHGGGYTIRAYTNWMKNFPTEAMFSKRFYLGITDQSMFLVKISNEIHEVGGKERLVVNLSLHEMNGTSAGLRRVALEVKEQDKSLFTKVFETDLGGNLNFSFELNDRYDGSKMRLEIRDLRPGSGHAPQSMPFPINRPSKIDLQFLPEGGNLVAGLTTLVAFKAISEDGKGISVCGKIYDKTHNVVSRFHSIHLGMGSFLLTPKIGETYTAELDTPLGATTIYRVPKVQASGTVMRVIGNLQDSDSLRLEITASAAVRNSGLPFYLVVSTRGIACYAQTIDWSKSFISISKKLFPTGIARFSLLQDQTPLNERIVFIDHHDSFRISTRSNKPFFGTRDSVNILIRVVDNAGQPVAGNFSISVTDDAQVNADTMRNSSIVTNILLSSELRGAVENPGQYAYGKTAKIWSALDLLLLTQGWIGYDWNDVFNPPKAPQFEPEKDNQISGGVIHDNGKPIPGAPVILKIDKPFRLLTTVTDQAGRFTFDQIPKTDTLSYFLQARTASGKKLKFGSVYLKGFYPAQFPETLTGWLQPDYVNAGSKYLKYLENKNKGSIKESNPATGIALREVKITSKKINYNSFNRNGHGQADLVLEKLDLDKSATNGLYELLRQKLPGLRFKFTYTESNRKGYCLYIGSKRVKIAVDRGEPSLTLGDTPQALKEVLDDIKIATMSSVEIMYSQKYLWKYVPPDVAKQFTPGERAKISKEYALSGRTPPTGESREYAIVQVSTLNKNGYNPGVDGTVKYRPLPIMSPKTFYSPKYAVTTDNPAPDLRATIYWNPEILTDRDGLAMVSFFTSDSVGPYTMILRGTDFDGGLGNVEAKISVRE